MDRELQKQLFLKICIQMRAKEKAADVSRKALKTEDVTIVQEMFCVCKKERLQTFAKQLRRETLLDNHCTK